MSVTETTSTSWFSRIGDSLKGILAGLIFVAIAIGLLFWNEGRTIRRAQTLKEGESNYVTVDPSAPDAANNSQLIYATGEMKTDDVLSDDVFDVSVNGIKFRRVVEMFQNQEESKSETKKKFGGGTETVTTYSYRKTWSENEIDSSSFHEDGHENPSMPFQSREQIAQNVTMGEFEVEPSVFGMKSDFQKWDVKAEEPTVTAPETPAAPVTESVVPSETDVPVEVPVQPTTATADSEPAAAPAVGLAGAASAVPSSTASAQNSAQNFDQPSGAVGLASAQTAPSNPAAVGLASAQTAPSNPAAVGIATAVQGLGNALAPEAKPQLVNGGYYLGQNPATPMIGDVRVHFEYVPNGPVSVVACQQDGKLIPYQCKKGQLVLLEVGTVSAAEMFANAKSSNKMLAWILRIVGFVLMMIGFCMIFKPLSVLADVIPFLGSLVGGATGIVAFLIALTGSCLTIGIAWLYYRPLIGVPLIIAALGFFLYAFKFGKKKAV